MKANSTKIKSGLVSAQLLESIYRLLGGDEHLLRIVFDFDKFPFELRCYNIRESISGLSHGQQIMVRLALDFWNQSGAVEFVELYETLDDVNCKRLILAICHQKQIRKEVIHALIDDEDGSICHL